MFYDIVIVAVLVLSLCMGYRRGFILTLSSFLAIFVALIGAMFLSNILAEPVMHMIQPMVEKGLQSYLASALPAGAQELPLSDVLNALSDSTLYRGFVDALTELFGSQAAAATTAVVVVLAQHIALQIAKVVLFCLSFIVVLVLWHLAARMLDLAFRLPVLNALNRWGGAAVGLLKGALLLFIAAWLLKDRFLPPEAVANSPLLHFFCTTSPLELLTHL